MRFRQIRLQLQGPVGQSARFFASPDGRFEIRIDPTFQLRVARNGERKFWIQLDGALVKLLALFQFIKSSTAAWKDCVPGQRRDRPRHFQ